MNAVAAVWRWPAAAWARLSGSATSKLVPQARLSGPMPWVIAIMVAMTVIAMAAGLSLRNMAAATEAELRGGITVQIIEARADRRVAEREAALAALRARADVIALRPVPRAEVDALIEPWLGAGAEGSLAAAVPVPELIDVQLDGAVDNSRLAEIRLALRDVAPSARADAQSGWLRPVYDAIQSLQWLAIALVLLLSLALAAAVLLAARTALGANRDTIEIVHLLGGTDTQIARVFQRSIAVDAAGGGLIGLALAVVVVLFLGDRFAGLGAGLVENASLDAGDWVVLALIPVAASALAMVTARVAVLHALRKML